MKGFHFPSLAMLVSMLSWTAGERFALLVLVRWPCESNALFRVTGGSLLTVSLVLGLMLVAGRRASMSLYLTLLIGLLGG